MLAGVVVPQIGTNMRTILCYLRIIIIHDVGATAMTTTQMQQDVKARLAQHDVRFTQGRAQVISALANADGPRSAAELHDDLDQSVPLSSLYRSMAVMTDAGVLSPHHRAKGFTRYELAEWLTEHHHHLVCITCGSVDDITLSADLEATLQLLTDHVSTLGAFTATGHALEIDGTCGACL